MTIEEQVRIESLENTVVILVEVVTLLLGENPNFDKARLVLFETATEAGLTRL